MPSLLLWIETPAEKVIAKGRYRIPPSIIFQTLALTFGAIAIAQPHTYLSGQKSPDVYIFFDNSASIGSFESARGKTRLEILRDECTTLLKSLSSNSKIFFCFIKNNSIFKTQGNPASIINLLSTLQPTNQNDEILTKHLLTALVEKDPETIFYVFSDRKLVQENFTMKNVNFVLYGSDSNNVAIEYVEANKMKPVGSEIKIFLKNFSEKDIQGNITLSTEGRLFFTQKIFVKCRTTEFLPVSLQEAEHKDIHIQFDSEEDNLHIDNRAKIRVDVPHKYFVVVTDDLSEFYKRLFLKICEPAVAFVNKETFGNLGSLSSDDSIINILITQGEARQNLVESNRLNKFIIFSPNLIEGVFFCGTNEYEVENSVVQDEEFVRYIDTSKIKFTGVKNIVFQNPNVSIKKVLLSENGIPLIFVVKSRSKEILVLNFSFSKSLIEDVSFEKHPYSLILVVNILKIITNYRFSESDVERVVYDMRDEKESANFGVIENYPLKKLDFKKRKYTIYEKDITPYLIIFSAILWLCGIVLEVFFRR